MRPTRLMMRSRWLRQASAASLVLLVALLLSPSVARADAPITRGLEAQGVGGTNGTTTTTGSAAADDAAAWRGVQMLPPLSMPVRGSPTAPRHQQGGESGAIAWLGRQINPGNWILDAGMGIFAGIVKMFGGVVQKASATFLGETGGGAPASTASTASFRTADSSAPAWSLIPSGCFDSATNIVFCTPANLTYDHPGLQTVWRVLSGVAASLATILFVVRVGRLMAEGTRSLATEGKSLLLTFSISMIFIQSARPLVQLLVDFFNGLNGLLLLNASLALPAIVDVGDLNVGANLMSLFFWVIVLVLTVKSFFRLARLIVLLAVAPLAGALLLDRATSARFSAWFGKVIEAFLEQTGLVIVFVVAAAIVQPYAGRSGGDTFVQTLMAITVLLMALGGPSLIGLAVGAGAGGYVSSLLTYSALRRLGGRIMAARSGGGASRRTSGPAANSSSAASSTGAAPAAASGERWRPSGDPAQSAAAQRPSRAGGSGVPLSAPVLRPGDAEGGMGSFREQRARQALGQAQARGDVRGQAAIRSGLLRRQAQDAREAARQERAAGRGGRAQALAARAAGLARKAEVHGQIARTGQVPVKRSRWTEAERAQRRTVFRQALLEAQGRHARERAELPARIAADEARHAALSGEVATLREKSAVRAAQYEARGEPQLAAFARQAGERSIAGRAAEAQATAQRLEAGRVRLRELTPSEGMTLPAATRAAAAELARSRQVGATGSRASSHVRRRTILPPAPTAFTRRLVAGARQLRAAEARAAVAQSTTGQARPRPPAPVAPPRRREPPSQGRVGARVRSTTIELLRSQRRRSGRTGPLDEPDEP